MKSHPVFEKLRIFAPGPTPVPEQVLSELSRSPLHHRTKEFVSIFGRVKENLQWLFQTNQPVFPLAASGTGAMETAIVNLLQSGDQVLVVDGGKFGERWAKISKAFGLNVDVLKVDWGHAVDPKKIEEHLKQKSNTRAVLFQASETSTGVYHPVKAIAEVVRSHSDALSFVDGITAVGVTSIPMDEWGIDVLIGGSQKALMLPPGLALIALSERAHKCRERGGCPKFYYDLAAEEKAASSGQTAWTPAVSLICGLDLVLQQMKLAGHPAIESFYTRLAEATRRGAKAAGLSLFAKGAPSPAVTAIEVPEDIDGKKIVSHLRDRYGVTVAGGQNEFKGKIFRIGHLGFYDELDILTVLSAVEMTLQHLGHRCEMGKGVGAAASYLLQSDSPA